MANGNDDRKKFGRRLVGAGFGTQIGTALGEALSGAEEESGATQAFRQLSNNLINTGLTIQDQELKRKQQLLERSQQIAGLGNSLQSLNVDETLNPIKNFLMESMSSNAISPQEGFQAIGQMLQTNQRLKLIKDQEAKNRVITTELGKLAEGSPLQSAIQNTSDVGLAIDMLRLSQRPSSEALNATVSKILGAIPFDRVDDKQRQEITDLATAASQGDAGALTGLLTVKEQLQRPKLGAEQEKGLAGATELTDKAEAAKAARQQLVESGSEFLIREPGVLKQAIGRGRQAIAKFAQDLSPAEADFVAALDELLAARIKFFTGAQASDRERVFFERFTPRSNDTDEVFEGKINSLIRSQQIREQTILNFIQQKTGKSFGSLQEAQGKVKLTKQEENSLVNEVINTIRSQVPAPQRATNQARRRQAAQEQRPDTRSRANAILNSLSGDID